VRAVVCHQLKHAGHWRRVKAIVDAGGVGEIRLFHATARPSMLRVGTHLVDAVLWLGRTRARSVLGQAHGRAAYEEDHPCPDHVAGIVELDNDARAVFEIGSLAPRQLDDGDVWQDLGVTVWGTHGFARVVLGVGWQARTRGSGGRIDMGPADPSPGEPEHFRLLADWLDDPRRVHPSSLEISYHGLEILMGIGMSSLERRPVNLPISAAPEGILERLRDVLPREPARA
jgi:predicted dehydrogenase